uniref:Ig-like domain-containing protein n=1 Tax=Myripristis murdjan TaxID=586833 RepID=A0A667ZQT7_9TELE
LLSFSPFRLVLLSVNYPNPICAVKGSTVTIPCTFTPRALFQDKGKTVLLQVVRVVWCQNHLICHRETPSVYDSNVTRTSTHFRYLGDKKGICTLQIENIQMQDTKTYRFRMEADNIEGHFTGTRGVNITGSKMRISGPSGERVVKSGDEVTFTCTAFCSFHRLGLAWYRDEHRLLEEGSALRLSALTAADSGNYSCALKDKASTRSDSIYLSVILVVWFSPQITFLQISNNTLVLWPQNNNNNKTVETLKITSSHS